MVVDFLLRKLYSNFFVWSAENTVTTQTAKLFNSLVRNDDICKYLFKCDLYWSISKICIDNEMPWILLPSSVKKIIIKCLIICLSSNEQKQQTLNGLPGIGSANDTNTAKLNFFNTILNPLSQRFDVLFHTKTPQNPHVESVIKEVMSLIETFNGIIEGTSANLVKQLFLFILPRLQQSVQLLSKL